MDPGRWLYVLVMAAIGIICFVCLLVRYGPHGLAMPGMRSIDAPAAAPQTVRAPG
jgi:hypothetical protein